MGRPECLIEQLLPGLVTLGHHKTCVLICRLHRPSDGCSGPVARLISHQAVGITWPSDHHRRRAMIVQTTSTTPKGQALEAKP